jgi:hypothetical protein
VTVPESVAIVSGWLVLLGDVKSHQLSEPLPDAGAWKCGLIKGSVAMRDVVAVSVRGVKLIEDVVKVAESQI